MPTVGLQSVSSGKAPVNGPSVANGGQWSFPSRRIHTSDPEEPVRLSGPSPGRSSRTIAV